MNSICFYYILLIQYVSLFIGRIIIIEDYWEQLGMWIYFDSVFFYNFVYTVIIYNVQNKCDIVVKYNSFNIMFDVVFWIAYSIDIL